MEEKNLLKTILCASAFGLIGCVLWGIIYGFGYLATICAYAIYYLVSFGYKKFAKFSLTKKDCFIIFIITLAEILLTNIITSAIYMTFYGEWEFIDAFVYIFTNLIGFTGLMRDMLISFVIVLIFFIKDLKKYNKIGSGVASNYNVNDNYNKNDNSSSVNYGDGFSITYDEGVLEEENKTNQTDNNQNNF